MTVMVHQREQDVFKASGASVGGIRYELQHLNYGIDGCALRLSGSIDIKSLKALRELLTKCLEQAVGLVVVDLSDVDYFDSTVLSALVGFKRDTEQREVRLAIVRPKGPVSKIFRLTSTDRVFDIYKDLDCVLNNSG